MLLPYLSFILKFCGAGLCDNISNKINAVSFENIVLSLSVSDSFLSSVTYFISSVFPPFNKEEYNFATSSTETSIVPIAALTP